MFSPVSNSTIMYYLRGILYEVPMGINAFYLHACGIYFIYSTVGCEEAVETEAEENIKV